MQTNKIKWQDLARDIFIRLEGECHANDIFKELKNDSRAEKVPTILNTVQKYIAKNRLSWMKVVDEGLEAPWCWGKLRHYNLSSEACLLIDETQEAIEKINRDDQQNIEGPPNPLLTIRQALWVARLAWLMKKEQWQRGKDYELKLRLLYTWACAYATHEILQKLKPNEDYETLLLDQGLRENFLPIHTTENSTMLFDLSRGFMHIDTADVKIPKKLKIKVEKDNWSSGSSASQ